MKKILATALIFLGMANPLSSSAFDLKDLLGGNTGTTISNLIEGVLMTSNVNMSDLQGVWTTTGSAVSFKDENLLKKAGGLAATSVIKTKIDPYFDKLGLNGAQITINADSTFSLKAKLLSLSGTISQKSPGEFVFNFKALGAISLGEISAYVQKTSSTMELMFDAKKLMDLISKLAKVVNISSLTTVTNLLGSYDGLYIGFKMDKTGEVPNSDGNNNSGKSASDLLKSVLGGKSSNNNNATSNDSNSNTTNNSSSNKASDLLKSILGGSSSKENSTNNNNSGTTENSNTNNNNNSGTTENSNTKNNNNSTSGSENSSTKKVTDLLKGILKK